MHLPVYVKSLFKSTYKNDTKEGKQQTIYQHDETVQIYIEYKSIQGILN